MESVFTDMELCRFQTVNWVEQAKNKHTEHKQNKNALLDPWHQSWSQLQASTQRETDFLIECSYKKVIFTSLLLYSPIEILLIKAHSPIYCKYTDDALA